MLTPTGYPPRNTAAGTAHSAHSTQPALRPHRANPSARPASARSVGARPVSARRPQSARFNASDSEEVLELLESRQRRRQATGLREVSDRFEAGHHLGGMPQWFYVKQR